MSQMVRLRGAAAVFAALSATACSPTLDWREVRPQGAPVLAMFPCRPDRHAREVRLEAAAAPVKMQMLACAAGGATYALSVIEVADPGAVGSTLAALRAAALVNVAAAATLVRPFAPRGSTPQPQAALLIVDGRLPDGAAVQEQAAFFAHGRRVFQASVIGARLPPEATETFFAGLKLSP